AGPDIDLGPLSVIGVPRGLAAVARRCLESQPARRYADGTAVAADLRRWLGAGITLAERPSLLRRGWTYLRRSPGLAMALVLVAMGAALAGWSEHARRSEVRARLAGLAAGLDFSDLAALRAARGELRAIAGDGSLSVARDLDERLAVAVAALERRERTEAQRVALAAIATRYRREGPWENEIADLTAALAAVGVDLQDAERAARVVRDHPLRQDLLAVLLQLERALIIDLPADPRRVRIPALIAAATDDDAWRAVGELLSRAEVVAHDLLFCPCDASERALRDPRAADLLLSSFGPEQRLVRYAAERIVADPGAYWPRVISARAAWRAGDVEQARRHALVALGQEPHGLWPHLVLAYVALSERDDATLLTESRAAAAANPRHLEPTVLLAVGLARSQRLAEAQAVIDHADIAEHLQYHLQHPVGHPMEDAVAALVEAGVKIAAVAPRLGPVVPHH
ncbi:MAG: hypothetical protein H0W72_08495, partial [Planctomycetes bacterium]|nr:hypothetical protein [Planctomycetota bacterium]